MMPMVELRIFHAGGYESVDVLAEHCLTAASGARFNFAHVRRMRLIEWSSGIDAAGYAHFHWEWERT